MPDTAGSPSSITTTAALLTAPGRIELDSVVFDPPGAGQVAVRMSAAGVCHTDLHIRDSADGWGRGFPLLLGHEGAGVVEQVGTGVAGISAGDRVAIACRVPCGRCALCLRGDPRRCAESSPSPATVRVGEDVSVHPALGVGVFAERVVVDAGAIVRMPPEFPLDQASILGCALMTGIGAVINTARVFPGASVAIIGCGGIGLSAVQGARLANAGQVVAIDTSAKKLESALRLGATDVVNAADDDPVEAVLRLTEGRGVDFAFEAVGLPRCVDQAIRMVTFGGVATVIGVPSPGATVEISLGGSDGIFARTVTIAVSHGGDSLPRHDLAAMYRWARQGTLDVAAMITHRVALSDLDHAFDLMKRGESIRTIVEFGDQAEMEK
jgi:S-(hydroxymethyl)mycothiol dehydrogenase